MQKQLRNLIIGFGSFIIFIFVVQLVFVKMKGQPAFQYESYVEKQASFNLCYGSELNSVQEQLQAFITHSQSTNDILDLNTTIFDELPETNCDTTFVNSNDKQIREMAQAVLAKAQAFYEMEDIKLLDTVYSVEERFAAYMQSPRPYLFFALTSDEQQMVAYTVIPTSEGLNIESLWSLEESKDNAFVQKEVGKLLYIFNIKAF